MIPKRLNAEELLDEVDRLRGIAALVVATRAKFLRAKEEESQRSRPCVRRVDDARRELGDAIDALKAHLEAKP